jgi:hypothetical protein
MPIAQNRFNDPAIGQAFSNLAGMFAPPSGSDAAGYAEAKSRTAQANRLAEMFSYAHDPNYNHEMADRLGVGAGVYNPNQSYYSVDQTNATSRQNNTADNARAVITNNADNARALDQTRLTNTKDITTSMLAPVTADATRFVPPTIASMFSVPETQTGVVKVNQGDTATLPGGQVVTGPAKPLDRSQAEAQILQHLSPIDQRNVATQGVPVESAMGPDGKTPQYVSRNDAIDNHMQPYNPNADKSLVEGTANIGGKTVQVFRKPTDTNYATADGTPLPADVQVFEKAKPTGTNEQLGMKGSEFTAKNGMFYNRASMADAGMRDIQKAGYEPSAKDFELMLGKAGDVLPVSMTNAMVSDQGRQFYNNSMNFMLSILRPDTGAAFGKEEFQNYGRVFIPFPGDDPKTLEAKALARQTALAALQGTSAGSADAITKIMQSQGLPVPPEMAAHMQNAQAATGGAPPAPGAVAPPPGGTPVAPPVAAPSKYPDGTIIKNQAGQSLIRQNGQWVPHG